MISRFASLLAACLLLTLYCELVDCDRSHYEVLGVSRRASTEEIKKQFKKLSLKWHPDKHPNKEEAQKRMSELNLAKEVLLDDKRRAYYDTHGVDMDSSAARQREQQQQYADPYQSFFGRRSNRQKFPSSSWRISAENYQEVVGEDSKNVWVIQVFSEYSDTCPSCAEFAPVWEATDKALNGIAKFGRIDYQDNMRLVQKLRLKRLPAVFVSHKGEWHLISNQQNPTQQSIISFVSDHYPNHLLPLTTTVGGLAKWKNTNPDQVHVILISEKPRPSLTFKHAAHIFKDTLVMSHAESRSGILNLLQISDSPDGEQSTTLVFFRGYGDMYVERNVRKENLMGILDEYAHALIPRVSVDNYCELCMGAPSLKASRSNVIDTGSSGSLCLLIVATSPDQKIFSLISQIAKTKSKFSSESIQFGWVSAQGHPDFYQFFKKQISAGSEGEILVAVDWNRDRFDFYESKTTSVEEIENWISEISSDPNRMKRGVVPGLKMGVNPLRKIFADIFYYYDFIRSHFTDSRSFTFVMIIAGIGMLVFSKAFAFIVGSGERPSSSRPSPSSSRPSPSSSRTRAPEQPSPQSQRSESGGQSEGATAAEGDGKNLLSRFKLLTSVIPRLSAGSRDIISQPSTLTAIVFLPPNVKDTYANSYIKSAIVAKQQLAQTPLRFFMWLDCNTQSSACACMHQDLRDSPEEEPYAWLKLCAQGKSPEESAVPLLIIIQGVKNKYTIFRSETFDDEAILKWFQRVVEGDVNYRSFQSQFLSSFH